MDKHTIEYSKAMMKTVDFLVAAKRFIERDAGGEIALAV
jgi:hypothetical protein